MNLKTKLIGGGIALAVIPLVIGTMTVNWVATDQGQEAVKEQAEARLIGVRDIKKNQIEDYFGTIEKQVVTYANNSMIISATTEFSDSFGSIADQAGLAGSESLRRSLAGYYNQQFGAEYKNQNPGESADTARLLDSLSPEAVAAQYQYIQANSNPLGSKHQLDSAGDGSDYAATHAKYHPHIRHFLEEFGYYDIFLINSRSGKVVYSVYKELDYATSLRNGPYADSGLARAFNAANNLNKGEFVLEDFAPYTPSYNSAASFIATPVFSDNGARQGVLVFQMPVDEINRIMTHGEKWADAGLGASGEVYLVGPDNVMRSNSRFLIEDSAGYFSALENSSMSKSVLGKIRAKETSIGFHKIDTASADMSISGKSGIHIINDYRNVPVLSAYAHVDIAGLNWGILAEIDEEEAFAAVDELSSSILASAFIVALIITAIVAVVAFFFAVLVVKPILKLSDTIGEIERNSDLTRRIDISSNDEIGTMGKALNSMLEKMHTSIEQVSSATSQMAAASEEMTNITVETSQAIQSQLAETSQVATAVTEMTSTVQEVANNTVSAASAAEEANTSTSEGRTVVSNTIEAIEALAREVERGTETIAEVEKDSEAIGTVLQVIQDIAEQTNLLALNAAIEAARAGEHGRGFAVVADEVRTLASRTQDSTEEIRRTIEKLQDGSRTAVKAMEVGRTQAQASVDQAANAGEALERISGSVGTILDMNTQIASAAEEQTAVSEEIARNIDKINSMAQQTSDGANQTSTASEQLAQLASDLQSLVRTFKV